jgi:hypothetical protein
VAAAASETGHGRCEAGYQRPVFRQEGSMARVTAMRNIIGFFEHAAFAIIGFVLMVVGLALGVTMIMLPVGLVVGLIGFAMVVAALFARIDQS